MYQWVRGYPAKEKRNTEGFEQLNLKEGEGAARPVRRVSFARWFFVVRPSFPPNTSTAWLHA